MNTTSMTNPIADMRSIIVVGGGAAGLMAAIRAAENGCRVMLFERNERLGVKLRITGKGRCNLTNDCEIDEFLKNVPTNPKFLYSALYGFSTQDTKDYFEGLGVPLKTERGKRVFPVSDKAADVCAALERRCRELGVKVIHKRVQSVCVNDGSVSGVMAQNAFFAADRVIIATGGQSYPRTGSDGDGYKFAVACGHTVIAPTPSLVPITCDGNICKRLQGLSLKNVALKIVNKRNGRTVYEDFGEMMFTHFGVTGPMILSASAHLRDMSNSTYSLLVDFKPALDVRTLDSRLLSDFSKNINRNFENSLTALLPQKLIPVIVELSGIDPHKKVNSVTKEERAYLAALLKSFELSATGFRPIDEAIVTRGGVSVREIDPSTMQSKLVQGLFFAGEVIDVDAYTGGFNLQIAFSTAVAAANAASE